MEFLIGVLSGIFTGLGLGGGTVLILLLTLFLSYEQRLAQSINLLCFIPSSIICTIINIKNKNINFKRILIILIFGIVGSLIGSIIFKNVNTKNFKKIFGIFVFFIAFFQTFELYKNIKNKKSKNMK